MEKLIPLLNERHNLEWILGSNVNGDYLFVKGDKENKFYEEQIISKKFGFIKRLVENNKIDRPKVGLKIKDLGDEYGWFAIYSGIHIECLIMLLSISNSPIDDLVSYLR